MNFARRKELLGAVVASLDPNIDEEDPLRIFLPLRMHRDMLDNSVMVVEGERGAGKTALFRFLAALKKRGIPLKAVFPGAPADHWVWLTGFEEAGAAHPERQTLTTWGADQPDETLELFWLGHLIGHLSELPELPAIQPFSFLTAWTDARNALSVWVPQVAADLEAIHGWLDGVQKVLRHKALTVMVGYDELDRLSRDGHLELPGRFCSALVRLWLGLRRRHAGLRAKIFLRPDLFHRVKTSTVDASKLDGHVVTLKWTSEDVFRVLLRRLVAHPTLREWLSEADPLLRAELHDVLGFMPPEALPELPEGLPRARQLPFAFLPNTGPLVTEAKEPTQEAVAALLAGRNMKSGPKKARTHLWILNHSSDGLRQSLPRVTLNLIRNAAQGALDRNIAHEGEALLSPSDLEAAQGPTGDQRLRELRESHPMVWRMEHLRDEIVPMDLDVAIGALSQPHPDHPDEGYDGARALDALVRLGVMLRREPAKNKTSPRADVPDLFRRSLNIKRRGGPLQIRVRI